MIMKTRPVFVSILIVAALFVACQKEHFKPQSAPTGTMSFATNILPIFTTCYGSGCHSGSQAPDLIAANAYSSLVDGGYVDTVNADQSISYKRISATTGYMPPSGKLSGDKIGMILLWIKQGAHNN